MGVFNWREHYQKLPFYPTHVAIIMDGNGRWARRRALPRSYGHFKGSEKIREIAYACLDFNIKALTIYAFSTENWKRPKEEVDYLFSLVDKFFNDWKDELIENEVCMRFSGFTSQLPEQLQATIRHIIHATSKFNKLTINVCLNYGSTKEIVKATKEIAAKVKDESIKIADIDESMIDKHLFTNNLPPVDLMIRTGGEKRISNFLLYQLAYSEIYFCDTLWPDFNKRNLYKALKDYSKRNRRYGGIKQ